MAGKFEEWLRLIRNVCRFPDECEISECAARDSLAVGRE